MAWALEEQEEVFREHKARRLEWKGTLILGADGGCSASAMDRGREAMEFGDDCTAVPTLGSPARLPRVWVRGSEAVTGVRIAVTRFSWDVTPQSGEIFSSEIKGSV